MRRGKSLLGQTISLYCTQQVKFRVTSSCQTGPGLLIKIAGNSYFGPFAGRTYIASKYGVRRLLRLKNCNRAAKTGSQRHKEGRRAGDSCCLCEETEPV